MVEWVCFPRKETFNDEKSEKTGKDLRILMI